MAVKGVTGTDRGTAQRYLLCTGDGTYFTSLGGAWEEVLGWTEEELRSRPFADFIHPRDRQRTMAEAAKVTLAGYEVVGFENRYRARHGQWKRLRWSGRTDGTCWVGVAIDVTDETGLASAVGPEPAAAASADFVRLGLGTRVAPAAAAAAAVLCLLVLAATHPDAVGLSDGPPEPAWSGQEGPPALIGPVDGAGPLDTAALGGAPASRLLGPRPEPPGTSTRSLAAASRRADG